MIYRIWPCKPTGSKRYPRRFNSHVDNFYQAILGNRFSIGGNSSRRSHPRFNSNHNNNNGNWSKRGKSQPRSRSRSANERCFYNQRFGARANKCIKPCCWVKRKKKLERSARVETSKCSPYVFKRFHIRDIRSGLVFIVDTDFDVSLLLANRKVLHSKPDYLALFAANNSRVATFGTRRLQLDFSIRHQISWNFCFAAVPHPIIGADLRSHFQLVPVLHRSCLYDTVTVLAFTVSLKAQLFRKLVSLINEITTRKS